MTSQQKPLNVWLYVILSTLPIVGYYPIKKLKKFRKAFVINLLIVGIGYGLFFLTHNPIPRICVIPVSTVVQCILVYNWVKEHNKNLSQNINT